MFSYHLAVHRYKYHAPSPFLFSANCCTIWGLIKYRREWGFPHLLFCCTYLLELRLCKTKFQVTTRFYEVWGSFWYLLLLVCCVRSLGRSWKNPRRQWWAIPQLFSRLLRSSLSWWVFPLWWWLVVVRMLKLEDLRTICTTFSWNKLFSTSQVDTARGFVSGLMMTATFKINIERWGG